MQNHICVEICIASVEDAIVAAQGGAGCVELNAALELGGLTPSLGLLREVRQAVDLPIVAMIRPRPGGFCYSEAEFRVIRREIDLVMENGADGIAFGMLRPDGRIDADRCEQIVRQLGPHTPGRRQGAVFHRAFDFTPNPLESLDELIDLGVHRVMTSGQRPTAMEGAALIRQLIERARGRIEILPAGGIRAANVAGLIQSARCDQVHASVREPREDSSVAGRPDLCLGGAGSLPNQFQGASPALLQDLIFAARSAATSLPPSA